MHVYTGEAQGRASTQWALCDENEIPAPPQVTTVSSRSLPIHVGWHIYMHEIGPVQLRMDIHTSDLLQSLPVHTQTLLNLPMLSRASRSSMAMCIFSSRGLTSPPWKLGENLLSCCIKRQPELNKVEGVMSHMQRRWRHETAADNLPSFMINTIRHYKE